MGTDGERSGGLAGAAMVGASVAAVVVALLLMGDPPWTLCLDNRGSFLGQTLEAYRAWTSGRLPQWTNAFWGGFPLLGDPTSAALYPPHLLAFAVTPAPHLRAFDVAFGLHMGLLVAGAVYLLCLLGVRPAAAVFGGVLTLLSPFEHYAGLAFFPVLGALTWWPWSFAAAERLARPETAAIGRWAVLGWIALAAQVLVGDPEFALYGGLVSGMWLLTRRAGLPVHRRLLRAGLLGLGAVALAAPQLLPAIRYLPATWRAVGQTNATLTSLWLGDPLGLVLAGRGPIGGFPFFFGLATVSLALVAVVTRRPRSLFLAGAALVGFVLALGAQTPLYDLLHALPPFYLFRGPFKFLPLAEFAVAWLAALGVGPLCRTTRRPALALAVLLALGAVGERAAYVWRWIPFYGEMRRYDASAPDAVRGLRATSLARDSGSPRPWVLEFPGRALIRVIGNLTAAAGLDAVTGGGVAMLGHAHTRLILVHSPGRALLDLFGVGFVVVMQPHCRAVAERLGLPVSEENDVLCVLSNPIRWDRFTLLARVAAVESVDAMLAAVERGATAPVPVVAAEPVADSTGGTVTVREFGPGWTRLETVAAETTFLLARESLVPGWEARVDGAPVAVHPAAGIFFAVRVPPGRHDVDLVYRAPGFLPGLVVAAVWSVAAAGWALRRPRAPGAMRGARRGISA